MRRPCGEALSSWLPSCVQVMAAHTAAFYLIFNLPMDLVFKVGAWGPLSGKKLRLSSTLRGPGAGFSPGG